MSLTFDNLIAIHELLFPQTNLEKQLAKYEEEHQEYKEALYATEESLYELADMVIVSAGVARFDYARGIGLLVDTLYAAEFPIDGILQAVETKMLQNFRRDWTKKDGLYKHVKGIED